VGDGERASHPPYLPILPLSTRPPLGPALCMRGRAHCLSSNFMSLYNSCVAKGFQVQILIKNIAGSQELVLSCHLPSTTTTAIPKRSKHHCRCQCRRHHPVVMMSSVTAARMPVTTQTIFAPRRSFNNTSTTQAITVSFSTCRTN
jgi:hypothetical protein